MSAIWINIKTKRNSQKTIEGRIFQIADKFSIFDSEIIETILKHGTFPLKKDDINFLKMMSEKSFELIKDFKR
jgi:hypothetical protein